ncbi:MAG: NFACT family protein [Clostridia bacterium]|nr:NFACT family protein [Clostridia bacterium]
MALDGLYLSCLARELDAGLTDTRIDKIFQPTREELVIAFRGREKNYKLYISARVNSPRIHFTDIRLENPKVPPMFCMLLRKRLTGGRFVGIRQKGLERAVYLDFDCVNELGDIVRQTIAAELMGKHSNIILIDENDKVVDAVKRVDLSMSPIRPILPGVVYADPPALQDRMDISSALPTAVTAAIIKTGKPLSSAILQVTCGLAPVLCREIAIRVTGDADFLADTLDAAQTEKLTALLTRLQHIANGAQAGTPYLLYKENGVPLEYSVLPLLQYGACDAKQADSFSAVLDEFYEKRDAAERFRQRTADLTRVLTANRERLEKKLSIQRQEWKASGDREKNRIYADLINANMYRIPKGAASATLINYFDPDCKEIEVPLDPALSAAANAQKYYKAYRKAQTAEKILAEQIEKGEAERIYLESVADALTRAVTSEDIDTLRQELADGGYLRMTRTGKKTAPPMKPKTFVSDDGFTILVGRNNIENDRLTTKTAKGSDIWMHVKNIAGSHVIVLCDGKTPPDRTLEQAAILAALHSKASQSKQVPVDYTQVKNVHKPAGAKPGFVIYETNRTAYVDPDPALAERLAKNTVS